jgi:uncharacterized repeat protein (TIGR03803 family)
MLNLDVLKRICILSLFYAATATASFAQTAPVSAPAATKFTTLHSFDGTDGELATGQLVQGTDGKFYGTTSGGGANDVGTVFSVTAGGALTTLHSFDVADGKCPYAGLIQGTNGKFYGTTELGGPTAPMARFSALRPGAR